MGHNKHDITGNRKQWGGTGVMSHGKMKHFGMGAGIDKAQLGRWTWARHRGKGGIVFRIVSIYQPCTNKNGEQSVYAQHKTHLQTHNDDRDPRKAFMEDFQLELSEWIDQGDQIVVGGDVNESVFHRSITSLFDTFNMRNLIFDMHDPTHAPKSYFRTTEGRIVDGLWGTPGIHVERCGYLEPGDFPGNHSLMWADITYESALGHNPPLPKRPSARRLRTSDLKCTKRYLDRYEATVKRQHLHSRQMRLEKVAPYGLPLSPPLIKEAIAIDEAKTTAMLTSAKKCRKLKMGAVEYSLATNGPLLQIDFWETAIRRRRGVQVRTKLWHRKKASANISRATKPMTIPDMLVALKLAKQAFGKAKKDHANHRVKFIETFPPKVRDRIKRNETARKLGRLSRKITGKLESKSVTRVIIDGSVCTSKSAIDNTFVKVNHDKVHSSEDTAFLQPPLLPLFGYRGDTPATKAVLQATSQPPPGTDPQAQHLLHNLSMPTQHSPPVPSPPSHLH